MVFNSYTFLIFSALLIPLAASVTRWEHRRSILLIASYFFYLTWTPIYIVILFGVALVDWHVAQWMARSNKHGTRVCLLLLSIIMNMGMLSFFKYTRFAVENAAWLLELVNIQYHPVIPDIIMPLGISFLTFQSLSYTIDVYQRKIDSWPSFLDYALFVAFFPKLANGPMIRAFDFLSQCKSAVKVSFADISLGTTLFTVGIFEKVVLADCLLAPAADQVFDKVGAPDLLSAWTGALAFSGQIFCDFAGYSTCAIGISLCLGFKIPLNFRYPYAAIGFSDFWRRWHITLSTWLRDYLYIPLGGNKRGTTRTYINLMATMLLGGLWHGASWTFVAWGGLHGFYLIIERVIRKSVPDSKVWSMAPVRVVLSLLTFLAVCIAWVFFRAKTFSDAFLIIESMFAIQRSTPVVFSDPASIGSTFLLVFCILAVHWIMKERMLQEIIEQAHWSMRAVVLACLMFAIITFSGEDRAFIYFQF